MTARGMRLRDWGVDGQAAGIPRAEGADGDWAPFAGYRACKDRNGRWRASHLWADSDEGSICCFCDELKDVLTLHGWRER